MNGRPKTCDNCNVCKKEQAHTPDSFEYEEKWTCTALNKTIRDYVESNEHDIEPLPDCPIVLNEAKTPKEKNIQNWKLKNVKLMKENRSLRKENDKLRKRIGRIHELSGSKFK